MMPIMRFCKDKTMQTAKKLAILGNRFVTVKEEEGGEAEGDVEFEISKA